MAHNKPPVRAATPQKPASQNPPQPTKAKPHNTSESERPNPGPKVAEKALGLVKRYIDDKKKSKGKNVNVPSVGGGVCWHFVNESLKQAGAMTWHDLNPGKQAGDTLAEQLVKGIWGDEQEYPEDALPGDVVLLSGYEHKEWISDPSAKGWITLKVERGVGHVGIIMKIEEDNTWLIAEQNNPKGKGPRIKKYPRVHTANTLRVFRPILKATPAGMGKSAGQPRVNAGKTGNKPFGGQANASPIPQS